MASSTRLLEVFHGVARVSATNPPAAVGVESVATMGDLPDPAMRPVGWVCYVEDIASQVVRGPDGSPSWGAPSPTIPGVFWIVPGDATLQDALAQASLLAPTPDQPVFILGTAGLYGTWEDDIEWVDNVIFTPVGGFLGSGMSSSDSGDGVPLPPVTLRCGQLIWTAATADAIAGIHGSAVETDDFMGVDLTGVSGATLMTKGCAFDAEIEVLGSTDGSSRWIDEGSFYEGDIEAYDVHTYGKGSVFYEGIDLGVGFGGISIEARFIDCSIWTLSTDTNGGADGVIDILTRGGEIVDGIFLDTGTSVDSRGTTLPDNVSGDGSGNAVMNRDVQSFVVTTTGTGASDTFTYVDSNGDDLPYDSANPIPVFTALADDGAGGTMPTLTNWTENGFTITDYDAGRDLMVTVLMGSID